MNKYIERRELGRGSFGEALLVERKSDGRAFVAKRLNARGPKMDEAVQEAELLKQLNHANIIGYVESFIEKQVLWIIMEYADGGDLQVCIASRKERSVITCIIYHRVFDIHMCAVARVTGVRTK